MRKTVARVQKKTGTRAIAKSSSSNHRLIHPVIIYPYNQPDDYSDLKALYTLVARLDAEKSTYARPITVMDRKTHYRMAKDQAFLAFKEGTVARHSEVLDAWCVDTCQMWYSGLGIAFERGAPGAVYWLIPGDFNYGTAVGQEVLSRLHDLPEIILELNQDLCIGEIATDHNNPKQLIDTYGTFGLLYNWFPAEAREIRQFTERPRSEFFAVRHEFLAELLARRWYPYEQTVVMLLQAVFDRKRFTRFFVGNISDLPGGRESFNSALQQVERTERVLKSVWRERNADQHGWIDKYYALVLRSESVRRGALIVLENMLE
jgi:hypothetical protein